MRWLARCLQPGCALLGLPTPPSYCCLPQELEAAGMSELAAEAQAKLSVLAGGARQSEQAGAGAFAADLEGGWRFSRQAS